MPDTYGIHSFVRRGRYTGWADGRTQDEANRAALIDAYDTPSLEAPMRPGTAWLLGGAFAAASTIAGVMVFVVSV